MIEVRGTIPYDGKCVRLLLRFKRRQAYCYQNRNCSIL